MSKTKAAKKVVDKIVNSKKAGKTTTEQRDLVRGADGKFVSNKLSKNKSGKTGSTSTSKASTAKTQSKKPGKVEKYFDRRYEYKMKHGADVERTKQANAIAASITAASTDAAASAWHESDEKTKRVNAAQKGATERADKWADAYKNRNTTETVNENKKYTLEGLDQLQSGGSTKTVDPATGQVDDKEYHEVYSI